MLGARETAKGDADPIAVYKRLLRDYLALRPSGTRQRIAKVTGTHKSFISQIANPAYRVPLPAQHVETIMAVCHFSAEERAAFVAAYEAAHPGQIRGPAADSDRRNAGLWIDLSSIGDAGRRRRVEDAIRRTAEEIIAIAREDGQH